MDKHPKDYFIPNFGVDHDIIATQSNYRKAGGKLAQTESIPACNSSTHPGCIAKANTNSPWKQKGDPIDDVHNFPAPTIVKTSEAAYVKPAKTGLALAESVPACNSSTHPGCKSAITSAPEHLTPLWKTDVELEDDIALIQSDPICNSSGCSQYLHPAKKDAHPINYGVPDFGVDRDMMNTRTHSEEAGEFDPSKIAPDAYEDEFDLKPIWERKPDLAGFKEGGYKNWMTAAYHLS